MSRLLSGQTICSVCISICVYALFAATYPELPPPQDEAFGQDLSSDDDDLGRTFTATTFIETLMHTLIHLSRRKIGRIRKKDSDNGEKCVFDLSSVFGPKAVPSRGCRYN